MEFAPADGVCPRRQKILGTALTVLQKSEISSLQKHLHVRFWASQTPYRLHTYLWTLQSILVTIQKIIVFPILWNQKWKYFGKRKPYCPCYPPNEIDRILFSFSRFLALWIQILLLLEFMTSNGTTDSLNNLSNGKHSTTDAFHINFWLIMNSSQVFFWDGCH